MQVKHKARLIQLVTLIITHTPLIVIHPITVQDTR
jgi:hypothetical protein